MSEQDAIFQQAMKDGHSAAWDQNWEKAAELYRKALAICPDNPQALTSYGLALVELQDFDQALRCYHQAAEAQPAEALPLEKISQLYERLGDLDRSVQVSMQAAELYLKNRDAAKAIENWERVTRLDLENLPARSRLALVHERLGNTSQAVSEYLAVASVLQARGKPDKALQAIERALSLSPDSTEANHYYNLLKDFKPLPWLSTSPDEISDETTLPKSEAAKTVQSTAQLDPVSQACQKALTLLAAQLFDIEEEAGSAAAPKGLRKLISNAPGKLFKTRDSNRIRRHLSQVIELQTRNDDYAAANELQLAMEAGLDHLAAFYDLGYLNYRCDRPQEAIRCLQISAQDAEFALGSRLLLGELMSRGGKTTEAFREYLQALKAADILLAPRDQAASLARQYDRLIGAYRQQDAALIQERFCANVQALLSRSDWHLQLAQVRQQQPKYQPGNPLEPLVDMLVEANSSQIVMSISVVNEMIERGQISSAMEEAFYTLRLAPTYLPVHSLIGELMVKNGEIERAVSKFQVVSRTYAARGEMDQAILISRRVVELDPTNLDARKKLIEQLETSGQTRDAIDETVRLAEVHYRLADLSTARQTYLRAVRMEQQINASAAAQANLLHRVADIDEQSLDWRQALDDLEQIRQLTPDDQKARAEIVRLHLRFGQEQQAMSEVDDYAAYLTSSDRNVQNVPFLLGLLEENPELIPLRRRLVDAYIAAGKINEAVAQLDIIGESFMQTGDRTGAIQTIEKIISLSPPKKAEYLILLSQIRRGAG